MTDSTFQGNLYTAQQCLESALTEVQKLWDDGEIQMLKIKVDGSTKLIESMVEFQDGIVGILAKFRLRATK